MRIRLVIALAVSAGMVSCGPPEQARQDTEKLVFWRTLTGPAGDAIDEFVDRFNSSQDEFAVDGMFKGSYADLATSFMVAATRGSGPDVALLGTFEIREFAEAGVLADLTPYLDAPDGIETADWPGTLREAGQVGGKTYWVPFNVSVPVLYVNEVQLKAAGVEAPKTWDEFFDDAQRLTVRDANGKVTRHGLALWGIAWPLVSAIWSEGGELTDREYENVTLDDPIVARVMGEFQALVKEGAAIMPDAATGGQRGAFFRGEAAMILDSPAPLREFLDNESDSFRPAAMLYPAGAKGRVFAPGGGGFVVRETGDLERTARAVKFIRFMLQPEQLSDYTLRSGYLAFSDAARERASQGFASTPGLARIHDGAKYIRGDFSVNASVAVRTALDEAFGRILVRGEDVTRVLREADAKAEREFARERARR